MVMVVMVWEEAEEEEGGDFRFETKAPAIRVVVGYCTGGVYLSLGSWGGAGGE